MHITKQQIDKVIRDLEGVEYAVIDLFCGAGGTSTGVSQATSPDGKSIAKIVLCVNHDPVAIESHIENHPDAIHFVEDVRLVRMETLKPLIRAIRIRRPNVKIILWASLECTNFSKAKGGQARDADSRTLAEDLLRYIRAIRPDKVYIENVEEFMSWGPLDDTGRPISKESGKDYLKWIGDVCGHYYKYEYRIINSANLGARTSRKRYFGQFIRLKSDFKWPVDTHFKNPKAGESAWMPVRDVLNLSNHGESIFGRKKDLCPKTLERVFAGAKRYVTAAGGDFFIKYHGTGSNVLDLLGPASCLTTKDRLALIRTQFLDQQYGNSKPVPITNISPALTTNPKLNLVTCHMVHYLINPQWFNTSPISVDKPCPTLIARMDKSPMYMATAETGEAVKIYIRKSYRKKFQRVIRTLSGDLIYTFAASDPFVTKDLIVFMASRGIIDIKMRMLEIDELLKIQGFPDKYILKGTKTLQKKFIGNSVVPLAARKLIEANFS